MFVDHVVTHEDIFPLSLSGQQFYGFYLARFRGYLYSFPKLILTLEFSQLKLRLELPANECLGSCLSQQENMLEKVQG